MLKQQAWVPRSRTLCHHGHLEEFPWIRFVHAKHEGVCTGDLYLIEDASGDFGHITVECRACGSSRPLSDARQEPLMPQCRGDRPWLGPEGRDEKGCTERLTPLVRTASSAYFSQPMSALSIPDKPRELIDKVSRADVWSARQEVDRR